MADTPLVLKDLLVDMWRHVLRSNPGLSTGALDTQPNDHINSKSTDCYNKVSSPLSRYTSIPNSQPWTNSQHSARMSRKD